MKQLIPILTLSLGAFLALNSCSDKLEVEPTDMASKDAVYSSAEGAMAAINGLYRYMNTIYTTGYGHENGGYAAVMLAHEMFGDDMFMRNAGSAWFWYDHLYWVRGEIFTSSDRPNGWWTFFYKIVMKANDILANTGDNITDEKVRNNIRAQAYALRAFAYYELINNYQLTYYGNESAPGVPIYTEPTTKETKGKPRGKVSEVYTQITNDLGEAIKLFETSSDVKNSKHAIDVYVAYGLRARAALMMHDWETAKDMAEKALTKSGLRLMPASELGTGFNNLDNAEWMWGIKSTEDQNTHIASIFAHMDANQNSGYAKSAGKGISRWLYEKMSDTDVRKQWYNAPVLDLEKITDEMLSEEKVSSRQLYMRFYEDKQNAENAGDETKGFPYHKNSYLQKKMRAKAPGNWANDVVYMRAAEMYLIAAEASCMLGEYVTARKYLTDLVTTRDDSYHIDAVKDGNTATVGSYAPDNVYAQRTLLDEIYMQRRLELWGEGFRSYDMSRQKIAINRNFPETNFLGRVTKTKEGLFVPHPGCAMELNYEEDKWEIIMQIPNSEFTSNDQFTKDDQNP